jgi:general secretion pathway protein I
MNNPKKPDTTENGFTLIEVLLALSIIGMAMLAAVKSSESTIRNLTYLQERTFAEWVAQNAWIMIQTSIDGLQPVAGQWQANMDLAGRTWTWHAVSNPTIDPNITQITLEVSAEENGRPLTTMVVYRSAVEPLTH